MHLDPVNIENWLKENEQLWPNFNHTLFAGKDLTVTIVGRLYESDEYHQKDKTEEWFYQHRGCMRLRFHGPPSEDILIKEREMFLLPRSVPHLRVRYANSVGIVVQRLRPEVLTSDPSLSSSNPSGNPSLPFPPPINIDVKVSANLEKLRGFINNIPVYDGSDLTVMLTGGPSGRGDYHLNGTEEWFFQLSGTKHLSIVDNERFSDIQLNKGEVLSMPRDVQHNPTRRGDGAIGLVIECKREEGPDDRFRWYCHRTPHKPPKIIREVSFPVSDHTQLLNQLRDAINQWNGNEGLRTCKDRDGQKGCGLVAKKDDHAQA